MHDVVGGWLYDRLCWSGDGGGWIRTLCVSCSAPKLSGGHTDGSGKQPFELEVLATLAN